MNVAVPDVRIVKFPVPTVAVVPVKSTAKRFVLVAFVVVLLSAVKLPSEAIDATKVLKNPFVVVALSVTLLVTYRFVVVAFVDVSEVTVASSIRAVAM